MQCAIYVLGSSTTHIWGCSHSQAGGGSPAKLKQRENCAVVGDSQILNIFIFRIRNILTVYKDGKGWEIVTLDIYLTFANFIMILFLYLFPQIGTGNNLHSILRNIFILSSQPEQNISDKECLIIYFSESTTFKSCLWIRLCCPDINSTFHVLIISTFPFVKTKHVRNRKGTNL